MSLKHKVEENELDLSLNDLTEVPVKELAAVPKAIILDLSCNRIQTLPNDFATLTHLIKIDLSRNKLTELPPNFGNLINLQYLDFEGNQLKKLPVSFCRLKNLRWLDLKNNPLEPKLRSFAGDCLDGNQCQTCAKKVVAYMQTIDSNLEREKQKKLKEMREKEALAKAKLEKELEEQRRVKKLEKEKRKAESRARNEKESNKNKNNIEKSNDFSEDDKKHNIAAQEKKGLHWCTWFLPLVCILAAIAIYFFSSSKGLLALQNISMSDVKSFVERHSLNFSKSSIKFWNSTIIPLALNFKVSFLRNIHSIMVYISNVASKIELLLSVYF